ncbi:hypothetical protein Dda_8388 [Drechslerella dactyloides]|uniref:Uncharacterized protein n=1 Tax=Drechslerella dactyloides TaxID=74499 RepID=A0AAD6NET7_DREDA|nr:hypothetical protein Dda_8388 [Drechslerella dactyloides]
MCIHTFIEYYCKECGQFLRRKDHINECTKAVERGRPCGDSGTELDFQRAEVPKGFADSCTKC